MKIRILGAGWYGCHLAVFLKGLGLDVSIFESADNIFAGASGNNPARLHQGQHYPRSAKTREHCRIHNPAFLERYGHLTSGVAVNLYAIAEHDSLLDFGTYLKVLQDEVDHLIVHDPAEYGLQNVEGVVLCTERHIVIDRARQYFKSKLHDDIVYGPNPADDKWDWTIDCTFCANDNENIDRYEPCLVVLLQGPTDKAVTIMDGPFPSLYPWNEEQGFVSLSSAKFTPFKRVLEWAEARDYLAGVSKDVVTARGQQMIEQMACYYPATTERYKVVDHLLSIRAMPKSAADARLVEVLQIGEHELRIRAGKIDAVIRAEHLVRQALGV